MLQLRNMMNREVTTDSTGENWGIAERGLLVSHVPAPPSYEVPHEHEAPRRPHLRSG